MTAATKAVLDRLREVDFTISEGSVEPFGTELPFVVGVAWEAQTAQVAFVAESESFEGSSEDVEDGWRQLLFGLSGLRHHLTKGDPPALGTPVLLAVVDADGKRLLRDLVERLTKDYAMFQRVDLNLVLSSEVGDRDKLDFALAPLLPRCREALRKADKGETIGRGDLRQFWGTLRSKVYEVAEEKLGHPLSSYSEEAASSIATALTSEYEESEDAKPPWRVGRVELQQMRSFDKEEVGFEQVTVISGGNGSGKTSILEALELLWSRSSQRRPPGVKAGEYGDHLAREGEGGFAVRGTGREDDVTAVAEHPDAELSRSVLTQDAVARLVGVSPKERMETLTAVTGLEVPELDPRTKEIADSARGRMNSALKDAGMRTLKPAQRSVVKHLKSELSANFAVAAPDSRPLVTAELTLERFAHGCYKAGDWSDLEGVLEQLAAVDGAIREATADLASPSDPSKTVARAAADLRAKAQRMQERVLALRTLGKALGPAEPEVGSRPEKEPHPLSPGLAARWIAQVDSVESSAETLRDELNQVNDRRWHKELLAYVKALTAAADSVPRRELEKMAQAFPSAPQHRPRPPSFEQFEAAGFTRVPDRPDVLAEPLLDLEASLRRMGGALEELAASIEGHPACVYGTHFDRLLKAAANYELAWRLRWPGNPVDRASEDLIGTLLGGRLAPVLIELIASLVRFDWYFEPAIVTVKDGGVVFGGLATKRADRDARLLLNASERGVVGLSWFLALHLLQPRSRREVLVLDDPGSSFDFANQAGFVSVLRAFVRLLRPDQLVVATHDEPLAILLEEELGSVDGWPEAVSHLRCSRDQEDCSRVCDETAVKDSRSLSQELAILGLDGPVAPSPAA
jgi:energy-coupling factor transporter ATP-binding protein EcfA2